MKISFVLVMSGAYAALTVALVGVQAVLRARRLAENRTILSTRKYVWIIPQLLALGVVLYVTAAMGFGVGTMYFLPLAAAILLITIGGAAVLNRRKKPPAPEMGAGLSEQ